VHISSLPVPIESDRRSGSIMGALCEIGNTRA
jgi:hypothetical protein